MEAQSSPSSHLTSKNTLDFGQIKSLINRCALIARLETAESTLRSGERFDFWLKKWKVWNSHFENQLLLCKKGAVKSEKGSTSASCTTQETFLLLLLFRTSLTNVWNKNLIIFAFWIAFIAVKNVAWRSERMERSSSLDDFTSDVMNSISAFKETLEVGCLNRVRVQVLMPF